MQTQLSASSAQTDAQFQLSLSSKLFDVDRMKALQLHIKARKIVPNQSLSDNKVLQQGSSINGKYAPYSAKQLKDNLIQAIMFSEMPSEERASKIIEKVSLKGEEERRTELEGLKAILRERAEKAFKASKKSAERNQQSSRKKEKKPKLLVKVFNISGLMAGMKEKFSRFMVMMSMQRIASLELNMMISLMSMR